MPPSSLVARTRALSHRRAPILRAAKRELSGDATAAGRAEDRPLLLSDSDLARLSTARDRRVTLPILILEPLLPGQRITFGSPDPKFGLLVEHLLSDGNNAKEIGMIGINPHTGRPLNLGVTVPISASMIKTQGGMITIEATGGRRFECDGEPWKDSTDSFYIADVEIGNGNGSWHPSDDPEDIPAPSSEEREALDAQVAALSSEIPALMGEWVHLMIENGDGENSRSTVEAIVEAQGPLPEDALGRAYWVAGLLNPTGSLSDADGDSGERTCLEIRPAMLACRTDLERIHLAGIALQSSIDHLSGERRLF